MSHRKMSKTYNIVYISMVVSLLIVLTQIQFPLLGGVPITLQTLGIFLIANLLDAKQGTIAILLYLLLGCVGLPVFSSFQSGFSHLLGPTGGFLIGFIPLVIVSSLGAHKKFIYSYLCQCAGLILCYLCGCIMYYRIYHIFFIPTLPIMFVKDLIIAFLSLLISKELSIRIRLMEQN